MTLKPNILVSSLDLERIEDLLDSLPAGEHSLQTALQEELGRADIVDPHEIPPTVVTMNSTVRFSMEATGEEFCKTLVYPKSLAGDTEQISILAPVGSALLGLSIGDYIEWPTPGKGMLKVRIMDIPFQPEQAGQYHR
jgi:regulator of nucleoside diphosphate kinase